MRRGFLLVFHHDTRFLPQQLRQAWRYRRLAGQYRVKVGAIARQCGHPFPAYHLLVQQELEGRCRFGFFHGIVHVFILYDQVGYAVEFGVFLTAGY